MSHVILGLLLISQQSLYDLVKSFEAGVSLFYSSSSGSIKRALDGLLARGLVEVASAEPGLRGRKVHRVTDEGRAEFHAWMIGELSGPDLESVALPRLYFLGLVDAADRPVVLRRITARIETDLARLTDLRGRIDASEVPDGWEDVARHQRATLDFGIASHEFSLDWFRGHLEREESGE